MMRSSFESAATLDRVSTREELCEVMELLCSAARTAEAEDNGRTPGAFLAEDETEQVPQDEVSALTDLLLGQSDRPN